MDAGDKLGSTGEAGLVGPDLLKKDLLPDCAVMTEGTGGIRPVVIGRGGVLLSFLDRLKDLAIVAEKLRDLGLRGGATGLVSYIIFVGFSAGGMR